MQGFFNLIFLLYNIHSPFIIPPNKNDVKHEAGRLFTSIGVILDEQLEKLNSIIQLQN